ncbi:MAG: radical SAM protein [Candidatus Thorarchaeota archaeon]|nr:radical SAM protein [Candidatus Thorarchaeota archaeon]
MDSTYPFNHHPCWSELRIDLWERIHLPVARHCNVKCYFCDHNQGNSCHSSKPGGSSSIMTPKEALETLERELADRPRLRIVGISGPGEPLANPESFEVMGLIRETHQNLRLCLSTNGTLLSNKLRNLLELGIDTISVSLSTISPVTALRIYEWASIDGRLLTDDEMGLAIIEKQLQGIAKAIEEGIRVKVNTILIPTVNEGEMEDISRALSEMGVHLQNIVPLVPWAKMRGFRPPTKEVLQNARGTGSKHVRQFYHCYQCRSDAVGIPGHDSILGKV